MQKVAGNLTLRGGPIVRLDGMQSDTGIGRASLQFQMGNLINQKIVMFDYEQGMIYKCDSCSEQEIPAGSGPGYS